MAVFATREKLRTSSPGGISGRVGGRRGVRGYVPTSTVTVPATKRSIRGTEVQQTEELVRLLILIRF